MIGYGCCAHDIFIGIPKLGLKGFGEDDTVARGDAFVDLAALSSASQVASLCQALENFRVAATSGA